MDEWITGEQYALLASLALSRHKNAQFVLMAFIFDENLCPFLHNFCCCIY